MGDALSLSLPVDPLLPLSEIIPPHSTCSDLLYFTELGRSQEANWQWLFLERGAANGLNLTLNPA